MNLNHKYFCSDDCTAIVLPALFSRLQIILEQIHLQCPKYRKCRTFSKTAECALVCRVYSITVVRCGMLPHFMSVSPGTQKLTLPSGRFCRLKHTFCSQIVELSSFQIETASHIYQSLPASEGPNIIRFIQFKFMQTVYCNILLSIMKIHSKLFL